jgi:hypothetical protein
MGRSGAQLGRYHFHSDKLLGQLAQARGDRETALARHREGLVTFERLGMPEAQQVRELIANLESGSQPAFAPDPVMAE